MSVVLCLASFVKIVSNFVNVLQRRRHKTAHRNSAIKCDKRVRNTQEYKRDAYGKVIESIKLRHSKCESGTRHITGIYLRQPAVAAATETVTATHTYPIRDDVPRNLEKTTQALAIAHTSQRTRHILY